MRKIFGILVLIVLAYYVYDTQHTTSSVQPPASVYGSKSIERAFEDKQSDIQVGAEGKVIRVLDDDIEGSRHQRFIVSLFSGHTVLIAHNIDLAPRVENLRVGDKISFYGEYEWNPQGGVVHWTHHDPAQRHEDGWIERNGVRYQ